MTTDQELLERIDEEIAILEVNSSFSTSPTQDRINARNLSAWKALRAVVEREEKSHTIGAVSGVHRIGYIEGYNQCLADIKADIKRELG